MIRKTALMVCILLFSLSLAACASVSELPAATPSQAATADTPPPTEAPPTPSPSPTPEVPVSLGSGDVLFDIYILKAQRDIDPDDSVESIEFSAGEDESTLTINGTDYTIPRAGLAQLFAITDVKRDDGILELVFTDKYDPALPDRKYAFSWLYWWNGTEVISMGGLMDVKFAGEWQDSFQPADYFDANGMVKCLTAADELTHIEYMGHYEPSGSDRKLKEKLYSANAVNTKKVTLKQPCLLLEEITEEYYSSEWDFYWIPGLPPYTEGRIPNVSEGISIIAQAGEKLTIIKVYGKHWLKMKTSDGYSGWIRVADNAVKPYDFTMGWHTDDMFSGL